ncbi:serine/threonine protein kinase [Dactylosporangium vinaceum]|uniref:non-specific serine/threonine protein kinase n=1 Tax=Dactylosporangium vinaceum TaxID=53362 RepID=A0ABV5ME60_9ACTN|nr:serine/threonine-protein kinase [Dactylosporangium vinaceum]UAB92499.1 serine/threonine protein kinase [Dactylosporangium vinaceum]
MAVDGGVEEGVVAGRYRLLRLVGRGGMGRVWQAHDEVLDRQVAVKEILPIAGVAPGRTDIWERTIREARTAARLRHPNLVRVYDVHFTEGRPWIVMEYVEGRSLHATVRDDGPLAVAEAAKVGLALLDGLSAAHAAGVLHRDVTPRNVLLTPDGQVLLGDFGVAVFAEESFRANTTREDVLLASPAYVAPERVTAGESSPGTDLWSLGATLYLAVEGRPPYTRPSPVEQLTALMREPPDVMLRAGALEPAVLGLLRRDPGDRLRAAKARALLEAALTGTPPRAAAPIAARKLVVAGAAALIVGVGGVGAWAAARPDGGGNVTVAASPAPASPAPAPDVFPAPLRCTALRDAAPGRQATGLPDGWLRHDLDGFSTPAPATFTRASAGPVACFLDADGRQGFTVDPTAPPDADRVAYWTDQERQLLAGASAPAGYRRIAISVALYQQGAADWEYTFDEHGTRWHTLRRNFGTAAGHGFVVSWTAPDAGWDSALDGLRTVFGGFEPH